MIVTQILLQHLKVLSRLINNTAIVEAWKGFLFKDGNIYATNGESTAYVENVVDPTYDIVIDAKMLLELLQQITDYAFTMDVNTETRGIEITTQKGKYKMVGHKSSNFGVNWEFDKASSKKLPINFKMIDLKYMGAGLSKDPMRNALCNYQTFLEDNDFILATSDAQILMTFSSKPVKEFKPQDSLIINKFINQIYFDTDTDIWIDSQKTVLFIESGVYKYLVRTVQDKVVNILAAIPEKETENSFTVSSASLLNALIRLKVTKAISVLLKTDPSNQTLTLIAQNLDFNSEVKEVIRATVKGTGFISKLSFSSFLSTIYKNSATYCFDYVSENRPALFKAGDYFGIIVQQLLEPADREVLALKENSLFAVQPINDNTPLPDPEEEDAVMSENEEKDDFNV